ncbi:cytochrome P450 [Nocardia ninae]|uniref:Cytochrome P450 n=1 Tax=Nocardia ninae NBRC 108245 TaxID=1210091 RepID=A0A511MJ93_9NOCA|nr:cytochrome P450 [Nocardia ninae]GEM40157.1 cytochrome P450 [Nocardia ninae NBRC 108245]
MTSSRTGAIPRPRWRLPVLGDLTTMNLITPTQTTMALGRELGPIFERKLLNMRFVFVYDSEIVAELSDETRFAKKTLPFLRSIGEDGLFTAHNDEPNWRHAHDLLKPGFTQAAMRGYHQTMLDTTAALVRRWDRSAGRAGVDVAGDMTKLTLETIGRTGFSFTFNAFEREEPHPFVTAMIESLAYAPLRSVFSVPIIGDLLLRHPDGKEKARRDYMFGVVDKVIAERREADQDQNGDLLELMMRAVRQNDPNRLDERNMRYQMITFLVAGHETTSGALSFALYYLSQHPEVLARAQAEVDDAWGRTEVPSFEQAAKLRYVRRVLDEALRLWPTAPVYSRQARQDTVVGGKYPMAAGESMNILIPNLHRTPAWGPDVDRFDPDRFAPDRVRNRAPHIYKPFGTGERACIGRQFAIHESLIALGSILQRYDITADPGYRLCVAERLTFMPKDFRLSLRVRN